MGDGDGAEAPRSLGPPHEVAVGAERGREHAVLLLQGGEREGHGEFGLGLLEKHSLIHDSTSTFQFIGNGLIKSHDS